MAKRATCSDVTLLPHETTYLSPDDLTSATICVSLITTLDCQIPGSSDEISKHLEFIPYIRVFNPKNNYVIRAYTYSVGTYVHTLATVL